MPVNSKDIHKRERVVCLKGHRQNYLFMHTCDIIYMLNFILLLLLDMKLTISH